jgi:hypothetical protein
VVSVAAPTLFMTIHIVSASNVVSIGANVSCSAPESSKFLQCAQQVCVTLSQVYGGAISVVIGPYLWSFIGTGDSVAECDRTTCDDCSVLMSGISIRNSRAFSNSSGNTILSSMFVSARI